MAMIDTEASVHRPKQPIDATGLAFANDRTGHKKQHK